MSRNTTAVLTYHRQQLFELTHIVTWFLDFVHRLEF
jgi:hypothetical protein